MDDRARFAQAVELTTATYDQVAPDYAARNAQMPQSWATLMERFVDLLAQAEVQRPIPEFGQPGDEISLEQFLHFVPVLDAGCGPGRDARALAEHGLPVLGVDLSQGMLDEAGERTARRLPHGCVRYSLMDLRRLDLPDASCRGIWCSAALLHLPQRVAPRAVAELLRVARRGAPLALTLRQRAKDAPGEVLEPYRYQGLSDARPFYAYYTASDVRRLLEAAGWRIRDLDRVPDARRVGRLMWLTVLAEKP